MIRVFAASILLIPFFGGALAQRSPTKAQNNDLRNSKKALLSYERPGKSGVNYFLYREGEHRSLHQSNATGKTQQIVKLSASMAEELDQKFALQFVEIKYGQDEKTLKKCTSHSLLTMRGETYRICQEDKISMKKVLKIESLLSKYLKKN